MKEEKAGMFVCIRMRMLSYLAERGFTPLFAAPDKHSPGRIVWFFQRTPELNAVIDEYIGTRRNKTRTDTVRPYTSGPAKSANN